VSPSNDDIELQWTSFLNEDIIQFEIYRSLSPTTDFERIETIQAGETNYSYIDNTVGENTLYYYYIDVIIDNHPQVETQIQYSYLIGENNTTLQASSGNSSNRLHWSTIFDFEDCSYILKRSAFDGSASEILRTLPNNSAQIYSFVDETATPLISYQYEVEMVDGFGLIHPSNTDEAVIIPQTNFGLTATAVENTRVELTWSGNAEHNSVDFFLERKETSQLEFTVVDQIQPMGLNVYMVTDQMVLPEQSYTYRVKQVDLYSMDLFSNEAEITIDPIAEVGILSPNPTSDLLRIDMHQFSEVTSFEIIDPAGKIMKTYDQQGSTSVALDVSEIGQGIYFLRAIGERGEIEMYRFVKQ